MLGIGGMRALAALGIEPTVCHMNEGHSAFLALERIRAADGGAAAVLRRGARGWPRRATSSRRTRRCRPATTCFPPVPDGSTTSRATAAGSGSTATSSWPWAARTRTDQDEPFCMAVLALRLAHVATASASCTARCRARCGRTSGRACRTSEVPISHDHQRRPLPSLDLARDGGSSTTATSAPRWSESRPTTERLGAGRAHPGRGAVAHARAAPRAPGGLRPRPAAATSSSGAARRRPRSTTPTEVLDPEALTIGFARRFATYKRAHADLPRPRAAGSHPERHGAAGADHLRRQGAPARRRRQGADPPDRPPRPPGADFRRRIVFLEDYDMNVARYLVQGVDVWLNTPRRPLEASGTSGMKAAANGGLNLSIARRLVGRGWKATTSRRSAGRSAGRGVRRPRLPGRGRGRGALRPAREGDRAAVLRPRRATACRAAGSRA